MSTTYQQLQKQVESITISRKIWDSRKVRQQLNVLCSMAVEEYKERLLNGTMTQQKEEKVVTPTINPTKGDTLDCSKRNPNQMPGVWFHCTPVPSTETSLKNYLCTMFEGANRLH